MIAEDSSSTTLDSGTSDLGASLPDECSEVEELGNVLNGWAVLSVRNIGCLTVVPLVGDGISDQGSGIQRCDITSGAISGKVLAISTTTLGPIHVLDASRDSRVHLQLTCHGRRRRS